MFKTSLVAAGAFAAVVWSAGSVHAEPVYGITDTGTPSLVRFDSASPGSVTTIGAVSGLIGGQTLRGIDFRPSNGQLYAISNLGTSSAAQLYTVNLLTGALTTVGSGFTLAGNNSIRISIDFNPVVDALRVVTGSAQSYRVNANTGALNVQDTSISPADLYADIAYSNNVVGASSTTLYAYDFSTDQLVTIGGLNGSPSPNGGTTTVVGSSGVTSVSAGQGFDISGATGIAYATLDAASSANTNSEFYTVNLATGLHTLVGGFNLALLDISVQPRILAIPEPGTLAMLGIALIPLAGALRRRRQG